MQPKTIVIVSLLYLLAKSLILSVASREPSLRVYDVGQGDAILLRLLDDKLILIDGGGNVEIDRYLSNLNMLKTCELELVVLTHSHYDHLRGLTRALEHCRIKYVIYPAYAPCASKECAIWKNNLGDTTLLDEQKGNVYNIAGARIHVLWPNKSFPITEDNLNNSSVTLLINYGEFDALLTGDLEAASQEKMNVSYIKEHISGDLEVFKVAHHGATNALNKKLLAELSPINCLVSVGVDNKYGHPHEDALSYLQHIGCKISRTDLEGTIEVLID